MNVRDMVDNWNAWGNQDPMYAILTDPAKTGGRWKEDEFFESGERRIKERLDWLRSAGINFSGGRALDFGCGIGRLTNALARVFVEVHGVDISASMIKQAQQLCRFPGQVKYFQNTASDLSLFQTGDYDLVYSELVLQHIPPNYQISYIQEFLRLLSKRGIAFFQTLSAVGWRSLVPDKAVEFYRSWKYRGEAFIPMYGLNPQKVKGLVSASGGRLLAYEHFPPAEAASRFWCDVYVVGK